MDENKYLDAFKRIKGLTDMEGTNLQDWMNPEDIKLVEEGLNKLIELEKIAKFKPEVLKRFKIELQPMKHKQNIHYSNKLIDYLNQNIRCWANWDRLPITITDTEENKKITINREEWFNWRKIVYEWLGVPKEVMEVL